MFRFLMAVALMALAGAAQARTVEFSFSNVDGNVAGTVTGAFDIADDFDFGTSRALSTSSLRLTSIPSALGTVGANGAHFRCVRYCGSGIGPNVASGPPTPTSTTWTPWYSPEFDVTRGAQGFYYDVVEGFVMRDLGHIFLIGGTPGILDFGSVWRGVATQYRYRINPLDGTVETESRPYSSVARGSAYTSGLSLASWGGNLILSDSTQSTLRFRVEGLPSEVPAVPLPAPAFLLLAGLAGLAALRRRRAA